MGQGDMPCKTHIPEGFHKTAETIGFGIQIGIVNLVGIPCYNNLGTFSGPADNRFNFVGAQILSLINDYKLARQ